MGTGTATARSPIIASCDTRHRLLLEFTEAVHELGLLHDQQVTALVNGDEEFNRFDILLHVANDRKQLAKYAYMAHVAAHGCGASNDPDVAKVDDLIKAVKDASGPHGPYDAKVKKK